MSLRVALCIPSLPLSGVGTSVGILYSGLREAGYDVAVVITGPNVGDDYERAVRDGWNIHPVGAGVRFLPDRLGQTIDHLRTYDVVINNSSFETQIVWPCLAGNIVRIAVVRNSNRDSFRHASWNSRYVDATVGISQHMVRGLGQLGEMESPVHLIPNCTTAISDTMPDLRDPLQIAYVGRLAKKQKNVVILPLIFACLQKENIRFRCRIAGDGDAGKLLKGQCERQGLGRQVQFLGAVSREDAADVLRTSNFSLLPSRYEGLSNVMLESMAVGCVPIVSDFPDFDWVLGHVSSDLRGPVDDAPAYTRRIARLVARPGRYREIQGYLRARQRCMFTPQATVTSYLKLIAKLRAEHDAKCLAAVQLSELALPPGYKRYTTRWWRGLQRLRDLAQQRMVPRGGLTSVPPGQGTPAGDRNRETLYRLRP